MFRYTKTAIAGAILAATGIAAYAAAGTDNDAATLPTTKISMSQAVTAAEQHASGRATRAELEHTKGGIAYDVEVVNGAKVVDVKVDAEKGTVISAAADQADHDDDADKPD